MIGTLKVFRGRLPKKTMDPLLARVRAATVLEPVEHAPPPVKNSVHAMSMGSSSRDFSVALRLVDDGGAGIQRFFVGYVGTGDQQRESVRLDLAEAPLRALLHDDALAKTLVEIDADAPDVRALFAHRFWSARDRGDDFGYLYLRERFFGLAAALGSEEHVPALLRHVTAPGDSSIARSRVLAMNAITAITGFDRRYDDAGAPRDPEQVADELLAACVP